MGSNANTIPHLSEAEVALLLQSSTVHSGDTKMDKTHPVMQGHIHTIFSEIMHQRRLFQSTRIAELRIRDLSGAEIAGDFFASLFS